MGKARFTAIYLLEKHLPWTTRQIMEYMGLKSKRGITSYIRKVIDNRKLKDKAKRIDNKI